MRKVAYGVDFATPDEGLITYWPVSYVEVSQNRPDEVEYTVVHHQKRLAVLIARPSRRLFGSETMDQACERQAQRAAEMALRVRGGTADTALRRWFDTRHPTRERL